VDWGYFDYLEVFSKQAFETLVTNLDRRYSEVPGEVDVHDDKCSPTDEDL